MGRSSIDHHVDNGAPGGGGGGWGGHCDKRVGYDALWGLGVTPSLFYEGCPFFQRSYFSYFSVIST